MLDSNDLKIRNAVGKMAKPTLSEQVGMAWAGFRKSIANLFERRSVCGAPVSLSVNALEPMPALVPELVFEPVRTSEPMPVSELVSVPALVAVHEPVPVPVPALVSEPVPALVSLPPLVSVTVTCPNPGDVLLPESAAVTPLSTNECSNCTDCTDCTDCNDCKTVCGCSSPKLKN